MAQRTRWLCLFVLFLSSVARAGEPTPESRRLWERGQQALKQELWDTAIEYYRESLAEDPTFLRNHLGIAAALLEKGDRPGACEHLTKYLAAYPEHVSVRVHYAELLFRLGRLADARTQFEHALADAQELPGGESSLLIKCNCKLMEIAEMLDDSYAERLHRGIGLYLLGRERVALPKPEGELPAEGLFCRAVDELNQARTCRPAEARPNWYLYQVWSHLAQRQPAQRSLRQAEAAMPFTFLTPAERVGLQIACRKQDLESGSK